VYALIATSGIITYNLLSNDSLRVLDLIKVTLHHLNNAEGQRTRSVTGHSRKKFIERRDESNDVDNHSRLTVDLFRPLLLSMFETTTKAPPSVDA